MLVQFQVVFFWYQFISNFHTWINFECSIWCIKLPCYNCKTAIYYYFFFYYFITNIPKRQILLFFFKISCPILYFFSSNSRIILSSSHKYLLDFTLVFILIIKRSSHLVRICCVRHLLSIFQVLLYFIWLKSLVKYHYYSYL